MNNKYLRITIEAAIVVVTVLIIAIVVNITLARIRVEGESMDPTLLDSQYVLIGELPTAKAGWLPGSSSVARLPQQIRDLHTVPRRDFPWLPR